MKLLKQLAALVCCVLLVLSFAACKEEDKDKGIEKTETKEITTTLAETTVAQTVPVTSAPASTGEVSENETDEPDAPDAPSISVEVPEGHDPVAASYFDDAAFVGDSVSLKLSYYAMSTGKLGNAQFFTSGSLGANNALWEVSDESVHPSYRGEKMLIEDCIKNSGAKKVYLMLGMNDLGLYGIEDTLVAYNTLINNILHKSPDVQIVIQSMTPMTYTSNIYGSSLNNDVIREYNSRLKSYCSEKGYGFADVATVMYDENGQHLNRAYCSDPDDMGVHFTEAGCDAWIDFLYTHTN